MPTSRPLNRIVLQTYRDSTGRWGGRILRNGIEDGRVTDCVSEADVTQQAIDAGIDFDATEQLQYIPDPA